MSDTYYPLSAVAFEEIRVLDRWNTFVPDFHAKWGVWDFWERERFLSMAAHLKPGDILFDIGPECGWMSTIFAQLVGAENLCLFEPTAEFWPNIRLTWEANRLADPMFAFFGLVSDTTKLARTAPITDYRNGWPVCAYVPQMIDATVYRSIREHAPVLPQLRLDDFVESTGAIPDAITMDIEGAELLALRGAEETLRRHSPLVWVSLHPEFAARDYGVTNQDVFDFMAGLGYGAEHLATDHEEHWLFKKAAKPEGAPCE